MSQKTRAGNTIFFHHVQVGFIEQTIDSMFKISTLPSYPHLGALYSHRLTAPCAGFFPGSHSTCLVLQVGDDDEIKRTPLELVKSVEIETFLRSNSELKIPMGSSNYCYIRENRALMSLYA